MELSENIFEKRWFRLTFLWLFWIALGCLFVIQNFIYSLTNPNYGFNLISNVSYQLPTYMLWALFYPLINRITQKIPLEKASLTKSIIKLISFGVVISFIHRILASFIGLYFRSALGISKKGFLEAFIDAKFGILGSTLDSFLIFLFILGFIYSFRYYSKFREHKLKSSELESKLAVAELYSLKMQLQPHFLFNTLHSISTLMHSDVTKAEIMISKLSGLLRISLDNIGVQKVLLMDELDFIQRYMDIQLIRFKNRLLFEKDIDPEALDIEVPNLILQPIVENAVEYAVEPAIKKCKVKIKAFIENDNLILIVEDNGPGIKNIEYLVEGVGISNTKSRLTQIYNSNQKFELKNKSNGGLEVRIKIPANHSDKLNKTIA